MTPENHNGQDSRAAVLVEVKDGEWTGDSLTTPSPNPLPRGEGEL